MCHCYSVASRHPLSPNHNLRLRNTYTFSCPWIATGLVQFVDETWPGWMHAYRSPIYTGVVGLFMLLMTQFTIQCQQRVAFRLTCIGRRARYRIGYSAGTIERKADNTMPCESKKSQNLCIQCTLRKQEHAYNNEFRFHIGNWKGKTRRWETMVKILTEKNTWYKLTHSGESRVYRVIIHK